VALNDEDTRRLGSYVEFARAALATHAAKFRP
jgi:hypothetical protein